MFGPRWVVPTLRILLVLVFAALLVAQVFSLPGQFSHMAAEAPQYAPVAWGLLVFWVLELLCVQVVIVCTWRLLSLVREDRIFSPASLRWVNVIVGTFVIAWTLLAALAVSLSAFLYFTPELRDPGLPMLLFGMTLIGAVVVLLMVVLRALLRQATVLRTDMEAVI
jgi:hypothetical protein